ncbi:endonuclease/exonuclease/phosphatase family protein [Haloglycomyces albus]|uniref:endonuclease/exonuclease/phosphatase family protein n=1 Tax=Haloglycomyces albus TaxID=526067 RepID=UPI00046D3D26|nr:endonuclease/exonuclease/phosphatase family protein [Haloglycomyces albus]
MNGKVRETTVGKRRPGRLSGVILVLLSLALAFVLKGHRFIPNWGFSLGSLVETFLPWFGLAVPLLVVWAAIRRSILSLIAVAIPAVVWGLMFVPLLPDKSEGPGDLRIVSHNVEADNPEPSRTAQDLKDTDADILAVVEVTPDDLMYYDQELSAEYPFRVEFGTVSLWSKYELSDGYPVDLGLGWTRAFRVTVQVENNPVAVYVAHMPSVRVNTTEGFTIEQRDVAARRLGTAISNENLDRVILAGDLNGTMQDRALAPITYQLRSAHAEAGKGFGFTWPSSLPAARIDQILYRGLHPTESIVGDRTGSDHLPVQVDFRL